MQEATVPQDVIEWLEWFAANADFGPSDGDVRIMMEERFTRETGREVPAEYRYE